MPRSKASIFAIRLTLGSWTAHRGTGREPRTLEPPLTHVVQRSLPRPAFAPAPMPDLESIPKVVKDCQRFALFSRHSALRECLSDQGAPQLGSADNESLRQSKVPL